MKEPRIAPHTVQCISNEWYYVCIYIVCAIASLRRHTLLFSEGVRIIQIAWRSAVPSAYLHEIWLLAVRVHPFILMRMQMGCLCSAAFWRRCRFCYTLALACAPKTHYDMMVIFDVLTIFVCEINHWQASRHRIYLYIPYTICLVCGPVLWRMTDADIIVHSLQSTQCTFAATAIRPCVCVRLHRTRDTVW